MDDLNALSIKVKRAGATVNVGGLYLASGIEYSTGYRGGLFLDCTFFLPSDVRVPCQIQTADFVQIWCGLEVAWEGDVVGLEASAEVGEVGWHVSALGWWATRLMARGVAKPWLDKRYDDSTWPTYPAGGVSRNEKFDIDREERIRVTPKDGIVFNYGENAWFAQYATPAGQTVKRITFSYDFQKAGQTWVLAMRDVTNANTDVWSVTASGTGTVDHTFAPPTAHIAFWLSSQANPTQTGIGDGTVYGQISNLAVYTETGTISPQEIVKDCAAIAALSTDLSAIGALTDVIEYVALPAKSLADIITEVAAYGSTANAGWAAYVDKSSNATDNAPRLALQPIPSPATTRDYIVRMEDANVGAAVRFAQDVTAVINAYHMSYTDARGIERYVNLNLSVDLYDYPSMLAYGERHSQNITVNTTDLDLVKRLMKTRLAQTKDLKWKASGDIVINGWIEGGTGGRVPAAMVCAGKVLQITNYLNDLTSTGLRLLITGTRYNHDQRQVSISTGWPDTTDAWLARELRGRV